MEAAQLPDAQRRQAVGWLSRGAASPGWDAALRAAACVVGLVGVALRVFSLGRPGFWADEAWVAISTRVSGVEQFLVSLSHSPILWVALLRPLALLPLPPEIALRLLPLGFGIATLWLAWRLGGRLAGNLLGALLGLAVVAVDPVSVVWAQQLKPYTAEAALAVLAFLAADAVVRYGRAADVVVLALVLTLGTTCSNAQLLIAPPILAALAVRALLRGDRPELRRIVIAGVGVSLWNAAWFAVFMRGWLTPMAGYFQSHFAPLADPAGLIRFVAVAFSRLLGPGLGVDGSGLALGGLAVLAMRPDARWAALALLLLAAELIALSAAGSFPLDLQRTGLFVSTLFQVATAAAVGGLAVQLWAWRWLRPLALALPLLFGFEIARDHEWPPYPQVQAEDLGPLVQEMERERQPGDHILLYANSVFVWGYYQARTPVLLQATDHLAGGFFVQIDDPDVTMLGRDDPDGAIARVFSGARRVWFLGSRLRPGEEAAIRAQLAMHGRIVRDERRERAVLLLVEPP
jgi:hypothetical protein